MTTPPYVDLGYVYPPPYTCQNVQMYAFLFQGDHEKIKAFCNRTLNLPENNVRHYYPLTHYTMVTFVSMERVTAGGDYAKLGYGAENEVALWIPTFGMESILGKWVINPLQPRFYSPFLFIDNTTALTAGREVYGFNKQFGKLRLPADPKNVNQMTLDAFALRNFNPDSKAGMFRLMNIKRTAQADPPPHSAVWQNFDDLVEAAKPVLLANAPVKADFSLPKNLFDLSVPQVFLKQFRAVDSTTAADYQSINEANATITRFSGGLLHGTYTLDMKKLASVPLFDQLGLIPSQDSLFNFWLNVDMVFELGTTIWKAG